MFKALFGQMTKSMYIIDKLVLPIDFSKLLNEILQQILCIVIELKCAV